MSKGDRMISINLYGSSDGLFVEEKCTIEKEQNDETLIEKVHDSIQPQLTLIESTNNRPSICVPTEALFTII